MQTIEQRTIDKSKWGPGEWQEEPDKLQWRDEATGLACLVVRNPEAGQWCGYVGVPEGHPAYGKGYDAVDADVHGGLTFSGECEGRICHQREEGDPEVWWLGFDAAHAWDIMPGMDATLRGVGISPREKLSMDDRCEYRNLAYMQEQCRELARQLHEMTQQMIP